MRTSIRTSGQLGPFIKKLRRAKNWSQAELGRRIGLSQERVSVIENHPEKVTLDSLLTLLMTLDAHFLVQTNDEDGLASPNSASTESW
jgi:HTH-type transcriptional regulator/antitoxin HipB